MSYQYEEALPPEARQRYSLKLQLAGLEMCPYKIAADKWVNDPKQWPAVDYKDVYTYLIKSPRLFSQEAMENYRALEAHTFFVSGWVQTVHHLKTTSGHVVFRADVKPSWRVTEEPHHPWVTLKSSGPVVNAHCDCMAGLGETCSHVGALLFKMEAAVRLGYTSSACTDVPCTWNACFVKNVQAAEISDIKFYKTTSKEKLQSSKKKLKSTHRPASDAKQQEFLQSLASLNDNIVGLSAFKEYSDRFVDFGPVPSASKLPVSLRNLHSNDYVGMKGTELADLCNSVHEKLKVTEPEVMYVEEVTRNQSASAVWHDQRIGRITASVAKDCLKTNQITPAPSLIKRICVPQNRPLKVPAIDWGNKHEEDAFRFYNNIYSNSGPVPDTVPSGLVYTTIRSAHADSLVNKSGLVICKEKPFLGASPDGVVVCQCCGNGLLEIKCPYKYRDQSLKDALEDSTFCIDTDYQLKRNHQYFAQVQMQMFVCNAAFADFVVWTPVDCFIVRVKRDESYIGEMIPSLELFWKRNILPEVLTRNMELGVENGSEEKENTLPEKTYCVCRTKSDEGSMVACDRCDEWYHPKCLGLKRLPPTKTWYCPACRKLIKKRTVSM